MRKKITVNIATYPNRLNSLLITLNSLIGQGVDELRLCMNEYDNIPDNVVNVAKLVADSVLIDIPVNDYKDNGKFFSINKGEYAFTCDDDIIYPSTYIADMLEQLKEYPIVTHHGRLLLGLNKDYYRDHKRFHCLSTVYGNHRIDVAGTGVLAFDSDVFLEDSFLRIANDSRQCMVDLIFSKEAARLKIPIRVISHQVGYFGYTIPKEGDTIFDKFHKNCDKQNKIADEIYLLNYSYLNLHF